MLAHPVPAVVLKSVTHCNANPIGKEFRERAFIVGSDDPLCSWREVLIVEKGWRVERTAFTKDGLGMLLSHGQTGFRY